IAPVNDVSTESAISVEPVSGKLVGRKAELDCLGNSLQKTLTGRRQIVFITGESESEKPRSWTSSNTGLSPTSLEFESRADNVWRDMAARRLTTPCSNHWVSCAVDQQEMNLSISWRNKRLRYWYSSLHL